MMTKSILLGMITLAGCCVATNMETDLGYTTPKDPELSERLPRLIRVGVFFLVYGILFEVSLIVVRYSRHKDMHDEFHALVMILVGLIGAGVDVWYIVEKRQNNLNGWLNITHLSLDVANILLFVFQIIMGTNTRSSMRSHTFNPSYYTKRSTHMFVGLLIWVIVKVKLFIMFYKIDQFEDLNYSLQSGYAAFIIVIIVVRLLLEIHIRRGHKKWRHKSVEPNPRLFNSEQKIQQNRLLDLISVNYLENIEQLFRSINYVIFENKVFDMKGIDHPGGAFITRNIHSLEISRYFTGAHAYDRFYTSHVLVHNHSSWAQNLLEERFIGFLNTPKILVETDGDSSTQDANLSVNNLSLMFDKWSEKIKRMANNVHSYDWKIDSVDMISNNLCKFNFTSQKYCVRLRVDPFTLFGKYFNMRIEGKEGLRPYTCVLSLTKEHIHKRREVFIKFIANTKLFSSPSLMSKGAESTVGPERRDTEELPLVVKKAKGFSAFLFNSRKGSAVFNLLGPFGSGLGIHKFSSGKFCLIGMGTGNNCFIDFVDFLARKMLFDYAVVELGLPKEDYDPWQSDFELSFFNNPSFSFYLSFSSAVEFEECFGENLMMIANISESLKSKGKPSALIGKILIRVTRDMGSIEKELYPGISFIDEKLTEKNTRPTLSRLGIQFKGDEHCDMEKLIANGNQKFLIGINKGLGSLNNKMIIC